MLSLRKLRRLSGAAGAANPKSLENRAEKAQAFTVACSVLRQHAAAPSQPRGLPRGQLRRNCTALISFANRAPASRMRSREALAIVGLIVIAIGSLYRDVRYQTGVGGSAGGLSRDDDGGAVHNSFASHAGAAARTSSLLLPPAPLPSAITDVLERHGVAACLETHLQGVDDRVASLLLKPAHGAPSCAQQRVSSKECDIAGRMHLGVQRRRVCRGA